MPLPQNDTPWLPKPWADAATTYAENDAWYVGDARKLRETYERDEQRTRPTHRHRGEPMQGGLVGQMAAGVTRFFWGRPVPEGEGRRRMHAGAPADLSMLSADLLFAEPPTYQLDGEGQGEKTAQARLELIMGADATHATLLQGGELASAFGATCFTLGWDTAISDQVFMREAAADVIVPEFRNGHMYAVTLWSQWVEGHVYWRHLERHEPGAILHGLYQGTSTHLGRRVDLLARPETEGYAALVNGDGAIETQIKRTTARLMLNAPAKVWRRRAELAPMGRSDYTPAMKGLFDSFDETWTSWMRDLDLGKARLVVPHAYLESQGRGQGAAFDTDREVFAGVNLSGSTPGQMQLEQVQFAIRVNEHERTANALYRRMLVSAGIVDPDDRDNDRGEATATGVFDETRAKERTRDRKKLQAKMTLSQLASIALELDGKVFPGKGGKELPPPTVEFPEVSQEDPEKRSRVIAQLRAASAMSIETAVRRAGEVEEADIDAEVKRIMADSGRQVPDPALLDRSTPQGQALGAAADRLTGTPGGAGA